MKPEFMDNNVNLYIKYETEFISWSGFSIVLLVRICISSCGERLHYADAKYTWSRTLQCGVKNHGLEGWTTSGRTCSI